MQSKYRRIVLFLIGRGNRKILWQFTVKYNLQSEWLEIDFSYWGSPEKERSNITALERAIINKYVITFTYFNAELTTTSQIVEPLKLVFKSHAWYLVAYSKHKNDIRTYKMSRIRELQVTNQLFDRELPKDFSITPTYKEEYNTPVFRLHFSEKIAYKVYDSPVSPVEICCKFSATATLFISVMTDILSIHRKYLFCLFL